METVSHPWPWYIAGPLIGLFVPALLLIDNRQLGISNNLRHICAAVAPSDVDFFCYDWKKTGLWNLVFATGVLVGGFIAVQWLGTADTIAISPDTRAALVQLGVSDFSGLAPAQFFSWPRLLTLGGAVSVIGGGLLVGFGTSYAGGCTTGHAIAGLSDRQPASAIAVFAFFAGGLACNYLILPLLF